MFSNIVIIYLMKIKESFLININKFDLFYDNDFVEEVFYCFVSGVFNVLCLFDKLFYIKFIMFRS